MRVLGSDPKDARHLSQEEAFRAFTAILGGSESDVTIGAFLTSLRWKGVTTEELTGFAKAARSRARIPCVGMPGLVVICPPHDGHESVPPLDVAAGIIAAGAGARVLIISDRCVPPRRGLTSSTVLDAIGLSMTWDPTEAEDWVAKGRFAAISLAGILPEIIPLRKIRGDLVVRTPLSTVEKLVAPPGSSVVLGAQAGPVLGLAVDVMQGLGHKRGIAIQGLDGGVIPSVRKRTRGIEINDGTLVSLTVDPKDFGLDMHQEPELPMFGPPDDGFGAADNSLLVSACGDMTLAVLAGETGPARNASILGAALVLKSSGRCMTLAEGVDEATQSIDSGAARETHETLKRLLARPN
ncbi:MAG: anthranilate phosphoribosyltransferase [Planctomycetota bacterium]|jgi:anthranilate phosphoribosyltransferase